MGSMEEEGEATISTLKLPLLLSIQLPISHGSPEHSGMLTPPLHTSASVPFRWEEEPGKPRPCTALITHSLHDPINTTTRSTTSARSNNNNNNNNIVMMSKGLELPPRLQFVNDPKLTKMPSPTTVLDGPYHLPMFHSSSLRFTRRRERQGSFGGSSSCGSPERGQFGNSTLLSKRSSVDEGKGRSSSGTGGFLGSWRRKSSQTHKRGKSEVGGGGGSLVFSSSAEAGFGVDDLESTGSGGGVRPGVAKVKKMSRITRNGSFSSLSQVRSPFWATIYEGFKQVLPWKSTNPKKDGGPF